MITVYASGRSRSRRVLWTLEELGAPYEVATVKFPPAFRQPEYLEINPTGTVPAMTDGDVLLTESMAICEYVTRKHGGDLVVAPDEPGFADYLQFLHFGESTLTQPLISIVRYGLMEPDARKSPQVVEDARAAFATRLKPISKVLADGREFMAAGRLTLADVSVAYAFSLAEGVGAADLIPAEILAYEARMQARPAYQRAYAVP